MIFYDKTPSDFSQTGERIMLYYFTTLLYHYLMRLAVDLNHRIGNNPASDVRNASCTMTPATTLHPTSAMRTRFQLTPDRVRGCDSCPACTATRCR